MRKGQKASDETRARMMGNKNGLGNRNHSGHTMSPEARLMHSQRMREIMNQPEVKARVSAAGKGKTRSNEERLRQSQTMHKVMSRPEVRAKISAAVKGRKYSKEIRAQNSAARMEEWRNPKVRAKHSGANSHFWQGGISFYPYPMAFTRELRRHVRERDHNTCQICGYIHQKGEKALPVHHVDYAKENIEKTNLIVLCNKCHAKTNTRREYWTGYLRALIAKRETDNLFISQEMSLEAKEECVIV